MARLAGFLTMAALAVSAPAAAQDAVGDWVGTLEVGPGASLPLVIHIERGGDALRGTLDSPAQRARGIPLRKIETGEGRLAFDVPSIGGRYAGAWNGEAQAWQGEWSQGGRSLPLSLAAPKPSAPLPAGWKPPSDRSIGTVLADRIAPRPGEGIVVGVLSPEGERIVADGPKGGETFDRNTVFEIGSISKVFTALILADMVNKGEVALDDPAQKYLPEGATMPAGGGRKITLKDLSLHQSGLPRLPDNMPFGDPDDPYADYTVPMMLDFLAHYRLPRRPGEQWEYSNFGVGLLGYLLARAAGTDYPTLLRERITGPLGMDDTAIALSPEQRARFASGYDVYMRPAGPWHLPALMAAGGIRSTAADMLKFAAAALDPASPIAQAMTTALGPRRAIDSPGVEQALGWQVLHPAPGRDVLMHNGGTGGYRSSIALEPDRGSGVVVLANGAAEPSTPDLALHLLVGAPVAPTPAVPPAPKERTEVRLPPEELDRVVGRYALLPNLELTVTREGEGLFAAMSGQDAVPIYPEAPLHFFWRVVDAEAVFTTDAAGAVTGVEFSQNGQTLAGRRTAR